MRPALCRSLSALTRSASVSPSEAMLRVLAERSPKWAAAAARSPAAAAEAARLIPKDLSHVTKTPSDSLLRLALPFGSDAALRARFVTVNGRLRIGLLLEELDAFAATAAQLHCDDGRADTPPPLLVTAAFDRLDLLVYPLRADVDLEIVGCVTYVGRTSLNVDLDVVPLGGAGAGAGPFMSASSTFVARDAAGAAVAVPTIVARSARDKALWAAGHAASVARKAFADASLLRVPPTLEELALIHAAFTEGLHPGARGQWALPASSSSSSGGSRDEARLRFTDETRLTSTYLMQRQDANLYGKVFGGFVMRLAFEAAFACGWRATSCVPRFLAMDDAVFRAPMEVGTLLRVEAHVVHAEGSPRSRTYSVTVDCLMSAPGGGDGGAETRVCSFIYTFYADEGDSGQPPRPVPRVVPRTYSQSMAWLHAHRRAAVGAAGARERKLVPRAARRFGPAE